MNERRLPLAGLAAALLLSGSFAACTQNFDVFGASSASGQGGSSSSASTAGTGGMGSSSASASASSAASASSSAASSAASSSSAQSSSSGGPVCGNGAVEGNEDCDDGNVTPADGCSATCTTENPDDCPGTAVPLPVGMFVIQGDTTGANHTTGMTPCGGGSSGDFIYAVTPAQDGMLTATVTANGFTALVYARASCPGMNGQNLGCSMGAMPATISFAVQAGQVVYVFVDGYGPAAQEGPFTLTLQLQ